MAIEKEKAKSSDLLKQMKAVEQEKADALAESNMPVEGLSVDEDGVIYNDLPLKDGTNHTKQLEVCIKIGMAMNPKLRVVLIREGSLLDDENLAMIAKMAAESDYQVWIERVDTSGKVGVVIEDGAVIAVDGEKVEAPVEGDEEGE